MKKIASLLIIVLIIAACGKKKTSLFMPTSNGLPYEVLVVCNHNLWQAPAGRALYDVLDTDVPGLPQSERSFRISQTSPSGLSRLLKTFRNIIEVKIDPTQYTQTKLKFTRDKYAVPQMILTIQSPNAQDFEKYVSTHGKTIIDFFTSAEMNRELGDLKEKNNKEFLDSARAKFGVDLLIPHTINGIKSGEDFLWASDISNSSGSIMNIVLYSYPYKDSKTFTFDYFINKRDSVMKINIPGNKPDRYMATDSMYVDVTDSSFRDRYMQIGRGLWQMENDMMGGPFVSHSVVDELNGRVIVAEAFVFAPNQKKRDLIRKLEAALFSLKLPVDKEMETSVLIPEVVIEQKAEIEDNLDK